MGFPTLVYKAGGPDHKYRGRSYRYMGVADQEALNAALKDGWHRTRDEALSPEMRAADDDAPDDEAPPTRDEMLARAAQIGLKVDGRWSDARLLAEIEKAS